jgi:PAT family beta-lactamase induction signal transducer AmpG
MFFALCRDFISDNRYLSVGFVSFVCGIQAGLIRSALTICLIDQGVNIAHLGFANLIFLPMTARVLWMSWFDTKDCNLFGYERKKNWLITLDFIIAIFIFFLSLLILYSTMLTAFYFTLIYLMLLVGFITTKESVGYGYQLDLLNAIERGKYSGVFSALWHIGFWISGAFLIWLSQFYNWSIIFCALAIIFFILAFAQMLIVNSTNSVVASSKSLYEQFIDPYLDFAARHKAILFSLFCFVALYRLQDRILMPMTTPFFLTFCGFSKSDLAFTKTIATFFTIVSSMLSGHVIHAFGYRFALIVGLLAHTATCLLFIVQCSFPKSYLIFYAILLLEKLMRGFEANVLFVYQMLFCSGKYGSSQISILSTFDKLLGTLSPAYIGLFITYFGWMNFFIFSFIGVIPALLFLRKLPCSEEEIKQLDK